MVFTPPSNNKNNVNNKCYKKLKEDYEKIINNRSALNVLVEEQSDIINDQCIQLTEKDELIEYWKNTSDKLIDKLNQIKITKSVEQFNKFNSYKEKQNNELAKKEEQLQYWKDYANDYCNELEQINTKLDKNKTDLFSIKEELETTQTELYEKQEQLISKDEFLNDLETELKYYIEQTKKKQDIIDKQNNQLKSLNEDFYILQENYDNLYKKSCYENQQLKEEYNKTLQAKIEENEDNYKEFSDLKKKYSKLEEKYINMSKDFSEMDTFIQTQDKQLTDYKTNNTNLAKEINQLKTDSKSDLDDTLLTIERLREIITNKNTEIEMLNNKIETNDFEYDFEEIINSENNEINVKANLGPSPEPNYYMIQDNDLN